MIDDERPAWMAAALCNTGDAVLLNLFVPATGLRPESLDRANARAKQICAQCSVREECLEYALDQRANPMGVWGGTSEQERAALRRERPTLPQIEHGSDAGYHAHIRAGEDACPRCLRAHADRQHFVRPSRARVTA